MIEIPTDKKAMLVEQIMTLIGRGSPDPVRYRRILYTMDLKTLERAHQNLLEQHGPDESASLSSLELPFPAVSLTENAGVIASADKGESPAPSGGHFSKATTSQSVLI